MYFRQLSIVTISILIGVFSIADVYAQDTSIQSNNTRNFFEIYSVIEILNAQIQEIQEQIEQLYNQLEDAIYLKSTENNTDKSEFTVFAVNQSNSSDSNILILNTTIGFDNFTLNESSNDADSELFINESLAQESANYTLSNNNTETIIENFTTTSNSTIINSTQTQTASITTEKLVYHTLEYEPVFISGTLPNDINLCDREFRNECSLVYISLFRPNGNMISKFSLSSSSTFLDLNSMTFEYSIPPVNISHQPGMWTLKLSESDGFQLNTILATTSFMVFKGTSAAESSSLEESTIDSLIEVELFCGKTIDEFNLINGTENADSLVGTSGADLIFGFGGDDNIYGGSGDDCIFGGEGNDYLEGGSGSDTIYAGKGDDEIFGGSGNDVLFGDEGDDNLYAISGNDTLFGGYGIDLMDYGYGKVENENTYDDETTFDIEPSGVVTNSTSSPSTNSTSSPSTNSTSSPSTNSTSN